MSKYETQADLNEAIKKIKAMSGDELLGNLKMSFYHAKYAQEKLDFKTYGDEIEYSIMCENEALDRMNDRFYAIRKMMK